MQSRWWQILALICGVVALGFALADTVDWQQYSDDHMSLSSASLDGSLLVLSVSGTPAENGGILPGDRLVPVGGNRSLRAVTSNLPAGTVEHWTVRRGAKTFAAATVVSLPNPGDAFFAIAVNLMRVMMIAIAILVVARRPDAAEARTLAIFLVAFGYSLFPIPAWLPDRLLPFFATLQGPVTVIGLGACAAFGCIFPAPSATGLRATLRRINAPLTLALALLVLALSLSVTLSPGRTVLPPALATIVGYLPLYYVFATSIAFTIGSRTARGPDRQRAQWAAYSFGIGFSGPLISTIARAFGAYPAWVHWSELSLCAIPLGLAYTILRHRTIDVGFVVSRALVLTTLSFVVIGLFGLLERALGKIFIDASHVASRSLEIALALGLGFSLRTLHVRIERAIDFIFFRARRRSLAALRAFAADVFYINDPALVADRTVEVVRAHAGAAEAEVVPTAGAANPDDPLFVRLRATRSPVALRDVDTAVRGDLAFPMVVRGELTGTLVVSAKRTGETYDPEERALLAEIALRAGIALDALESQALRRELEALRAATGGAVPAF